MPTRPVRHRQTGTRRRAAGIGLRPAYRAGRCGSANV